MRQFLYPTFSAILSGLIIGAAGFFLFSRDIDLTKNVYIEYFQSDVSSLLFNDAAKAFSPGLDFDKAENSAKFRSSYGYGLNKDTPIIIYSIKNIGEYEVNHLKISLGEFYHAYISGERTSVSLDGTTADTSITLEPRSSITLAIIPKFEWAESKERFTIDGKEVPSRLVSGNKYNNTDYSIINFIVRHPLGCYIVFITGISAIFVFMMAFILHILTRNNPDYISKNTADASLVRNLAIINVIKRENPDRLNAIIRKSEKLFARWDNDSKDTINEKNQAAVK